MTDATHTTERAFTVGDLEAAASVGYFRGYSDSKEGEQYRNPWNGLRAMEVLPDLQATGAAATPEPPEQPTETEAFSVYVDDMRRPANLTGRPARWSHLMADNHDALMQAALDLGLRPEWIQHEGTHREHFDVTETVRHRAIAAGIAQPISYPRGTADLLNRKRQEADRG